MKRYIYHLKKFKTQVAILVISLIVFVIVQYLGGNGSIREMVRMQDRDIRQQVIVEGLADKDIPLEIPVSKRRYTKAEAEEIFEHSIEPIIQATLAKNSNILHIESDLHYMERFSEYGISVSYQSSDEALIDTSGKVENADLKTEKQVFLDIILRLDGYEKIYTVNLTVLPSYKNGSGTTGQGING